MKIFVLCCVIVEIEIGEFVIIMGLFGVGKLILLYILGMFDYDWQGEYWFFDQFVYLLWLKVCNQLYCENIGFVFQSYYLIDNFIVVENFEVLFIYCNIKCMECQVMVGDMFDCFQIVGKKDFFFNQFLGGQQQFVGIVCVLIIEFKVIFVDEFIGNLYSVQGCEIMEIFKKFNEQGMMIVQVMYFEENVGYGDWIVQFQDGWVK